MTNVDNLLIFTGVHVLQYEMEKNKGFLMKILDLLPVWFILHFFFVIEKSQHTFLNFYYLCIIYLC